MNSLRIIVVIFALVCAALSETTTNLCAGRNNSWNRLSPDPQDSHKFHVCKDGVEVGVQTCPVGTAFNDNYQTCVHEINNRDMRCFNYLRPYSNPHNKHTFVVCVEGKAFVFNCPSNLVYNDRAQACVWEYQDQF